MTVDDLTRPLTLTLLGLPGAKKGTQAGMLEASINRLDKLDTKNGMNLGGAPRTPGQAAAFDMILARKHQRIDEDATVVRVSGRFARAIYDERRPKAFGRCDICESAGLKQDAKQNVKQVKARLSAGRRDTAPLFAHDRDAGISAGIPTMGRIEAIANARDQVFADRARA
ncbi:MAG: hypothetical protein AAGF88_03010 [Pseudomonadota bacterium]